MNNKLPLLVRFCIKKSEFSKPIGCYYSERKNLQVKRVNRKEIPAILINGIFPETKTCTKEERERED